tara:strand:+ start:24453 stop:25736 length:1284 start_codon:yes stop_codon:yes gene_type:complete
MTAASKMSKSALIANAACACMTLDRNMLVRLLDADTAVQGFGDRLTVSHPYLFANSPVFLASDTISAMKAVIASVESVAALPSFQTAALGWAPPIAVPDFGPRGVFMGYDFHLTQSGPVLIEINTNAGGAFLNAVLVKAQRVCCFGETIASEGGHEARDFGDMILAMFQQEWECQGREGSARVIAIVDDKPEDQHLYPEFLLAKAMLESRGITVVITDPQNLTVSDGRLCADSLEIDLVYNRLVDFAFEDARNPALRSAYLQGQVVVTPNPHVHALYADKRNLSLLSDPELLARWGVPPKYTEILRSGIPGTVLVTADNADALWATRRNLFFKPARGYGSKAAYRGSGLTHKVWSQITTGDYIAQQYAAPSIRRVMRDGKPAEFKIDVRLYTYNGEVLLTAARLYQGQTTNMRTPSGGFAPVLEVAH